jgi:phosphatidylinositol-bisphosphatase
MQDVPGGFPTRDDTNEDESYQSLTQAIYARRAEYVKPKRMRIKIGTWNTAAYKGAEKDIGGWFVDGKGVTEALAGLKVGDPSQVHGGDEIPDQSALEAREDVADQEARYERKKSTVPKHDPGSIPGGDDIGLYALGLQEVVDINSVSEALRPFTDPSIAKKWKVEMEKALPKGYTLVAEQQLLGLLLLIYAAPDIASEVRSVSTTSVGTGLGGYMGNKGAVTARIVLGDTTRIVFVNSHLAAGADTTSLERRNWDASQIVSRTRFGAIQDAMDLSQTTGEQIGDEDFAFWVGDLNYRLEGIPGDDVRRLLMLHTRNEYDLSQRSAHKIEKEIENATDAVKSRVEDRTSTSTRDSTSEAADSQASTRTCTDTAGTEPTLEEEIEASQDPTSLQTTLACLLPHDELHQQMKLRKAFHDGWQEGPINFLPTYKYDVGSVGVLV